jgi:hypothetical protein
VQSSTKDVTAKVYNPSVFCWVSIVIKFKGFQESRTHSVEQLLFFRYFSAITLQLMVLFSRSKNNPSETFLPLLAFLVLDLLDSPLCHRFSCFNYIGQARSPK